MPGLSFLTDRMQSVVISEAWSDIASVYSGLPQGFVLDPSLFLLHMNNLTTGLSLFTSRRVLLLLLFCFVG